MLYVSRFFGDDYVGVVDTDDDIEERVSRREVMDCVLNLGLDIKGAVLDSDTGVRKVRPYQDERYSSVKQTRLLAVRGIRFVIFRDEIVFVENTGKGGSVRLSDYASKFSCNSWLLGSRSGILTLVFDDKIELVDGDLDVSCAGFKYDIHEVTNSATVSKVYCAAIDFDAYGGINWGSFILDDKDRQIVWGCIGLLSECDYGVQQSLENLILSANDVAFVREELSRYYEKEFKSLVRDEFEVTSYASDRVGEVAKVYVTWDLYEVCESWTVAVHRLKMMTPLVHMFSGKPLLVHYELVILCKAFSANQNYQNLAIEYYKNFSDALSKYFPRSA